MSVQHFIFALLTSLALSLLQLAKTLLIYQRAPILAGEWWRLLSGNFVHTNIPHLLLNLAGFWILLLLCHTVLGIRLLMISALTISGFIGILLLARHPELQWYAGLSGVLYGLFMLGGIRLTLKGEYLTGLTLLGIITTKTLLDTYHGGNTLSQGIIDAPVILPAHGYGMLCGTLIGLAAWMVTRKHQNNPYI